MRVTTKRVTFAGGAMLPTAQVASVQPFVDRGFNFGFLLVPVFGVGAWVCGAYAVGGVAYSASRSAPWAVGSRRPAARDRYPMARGPQPGTDGNARESAEEAGDCSQRVLEEQWTDGVVKAIGEAISKK